MSLVRTHFFTDIFTAIWHFFFPENIIFLPVRLLQTPFMHLLQFSFAKCRYYNWGKCLNNKVMLPRYGLDFITCSPSLYTRSYLIVFWLSYCATFLLWKDDEQNEQNATTYITCMYLFQRSVWRLQNMARKWQYRSSVRRHMCQWISAKTANYRYINVNC